MSLSDRIERGAIQVDRMAGYILGAITLLIFLSALARYLFNAPIPDGHDFSRLLLGVTILWGLASVNFHGGHIAVDLIWTALPGRGRRILDILASFVTFAFLALFAWMLLGKVFDVKNAHELTFDLRIAIWPFYLLAWIGLVISVLAALARVYLLIIDNAPEEQASEADAIIKLDQQENRQ